MSNVKKAVTKTAKKAYCECGSCSCGCPQDACRCQDKNCQCGCCTPAVGR